MIKYVILFLPSLLKIWALRRLGFNIGRDCHIGFSLIDAKNISLGDSVRIESFNIIHRLNNFHINTGGRINGFNWITGARTGSFFVGFNSAITRFHFFEASGSIYIGDNTIIAGRSSHFFTHGISSTNLDDIRSIQVGSWCYVGSSSKFVPGAEIANGTFVGMGSVVTRKFSDEYVLVAGAPAIIRKQLSPDDIYFSRPFLPHDHHPSNYEGGGKP